MLTREKFTAILSVSPDDSSRQYNLQVAAKCSRLKIWIVSHGPFAKGWAGSSTTKKCHMRYSPHKIGSSSADVSGVFKTLKAPLQPSILEVAEILEIRPIGIPSSELKDISLEKAVVKSDVKT